jgi:hypothetical protein
MPSIKDLFKPRPLGDPATIMDLQRRIADFTLALNDAEVTANHAFLDAASGGEAAKKKADQAALEIAHIRDQLARARGALQEAENRQEDNKLLAEEVAATARWRKAEKLARARQDVGVEIDTLILKLADYYLELRQLGEDLYKTAPVRGAKLHNSAMSPPNIERAFRLYLFKMNFKWATTFPWNPADIRPFAAVVRDGNADILSHRPKQEEAA